MTIHRLPLQSSATPPAGEPPDNVEMEHRVTALETRLDTVLPTLATKADLADVRADLARASADFHKGFSDVVKWIVGAGFAAVAVLVSAMTFIANRDKPSAPVQQPPIIINVPTPQAAPAPPIDKRR